MYYHYAAELPIKGIHHFLGEEDSSGDRQTACVILGLCKNQLWLL